MHTISMMACIQFCICQNQYDIKSGLCQKNEEENQTTQRNEMQWKNDGEIIRQTKQMLPML